MSELPGVDLVLQPEDEAFFDGVERGELVVPWCDGCDQHVWPPRSHCVRCFAPVPGSRLLPGTGEVYSFSVVHRGEGVFAKIPPYVLAYVSCDDGPTIMADVRVDDPSVLQVGARVRLVASGRPETGRRGAVFVLDDPA